MHRELSTELDPQNLLSAYASGIFPMADETGVLHWLAPDPRAVLDLESFKMSRSLRTVVRRRVFEVSINRAFIEVLRGCADRPEGTWISPAIFSAYARLHEMGFAHSVEAWKDGELAGGLYGVSLGAAFFGESMFHRVTDASKVALAALVDELRKRDFDLLDVQFTTDHLRRFGAVELPRWEYLRRLRNAIQQSRAFDDRFGPTGVTLSAEAPESKS